MHTLTALLCALMIAASSVAAEIPLEAFFANPDVTRIKISPDGTHAAGIAPSDKKNRVLVIDLANMRAVTEISLKKRVILDFFWANEERLMIAASFLDGRTFRWVAINRNGKKRVDFHESGKNENNFGMIGFQFLHRRPEDRRNVLVGQVTVANASMYYSQVKKLNVYSGKSHVALADARRAFRWFADGSGEVRLGYGSVRENGFIVHRKDPRASWTEIEEIDGKPIHRRNLVVLGLASGGDPDEILVASRRSGDDFAVYDFDVETRDFSEPLFSEPGIDVAGPAVISPFTGEVLGVRYADDLWRTHYVDPIWAKRAARLDARLPPTVNTITSWDHAEENFIVYVSSEQMAGMYMLYREKDQTLQPIASEHPQLKASEMRASRPVSIQARDGRTLHGYLTLPEGGSPDPLPLVLVPNGLIGEFASPESFTRHTQSFSAPIQFLVNRGYAVLRLNERGSGGYGLDYEKSGYREWAGVLQHDIADAVKWAVAEGVAHPKRICMMGYGGYGGFAVATALAAAPDQYRCGIAIGGIYDIPAQLREMQRYVYDEFWQDRVGNIDREFDTVNKMSPIHDVEKIRAPILLAHGEDDHYVQPEQSKEFAKALRSAGKPFSIFLMENTRHDQNREDNRLELYGRIEKFLAEHLAAHP